MAALLRFPLRVGLIAFVLGVAAPPESSFAAGVTVITHGYSGNVDGWVTGMAQAIPRYFRYPGTNFTTYTLKVTYSSGSYYLSSTRSAGSAFSTNDSGEIIVKLDWSTVAGGIFSTYSTYDVGAAVSWGLKQTNLISELAGHALVEFPLHLIGHSRGGSLCSEISRLLGTSGVWVDHLTTLDPHPLNNDGFVDFPAGVDAPVRTYENVLFHDNYFQELGDGLLDPRGEPVAGSYSRQLTSLAGGYQGSIAPNHSNVHLWYYGTIDWATPASDTEATISGAERTAWWTPYEGQGTIAGFCYSLLGGADRLSLDQPVGTGFGAIRDGYNQFWDLGAGVSGNRTALTSNSGEWPNPIRLNLLVTNSVVQGQNVNARLYWQWAQPSTSTGKVLFYLDDDLNPLNSNDYLVAEELLVGSGPGSVNSRTLTLSLKATNAPAGSYALYAKVIGRGQTRYLYAPEPLDIIIAPQSLTLHISQLPTGQVQILTSGQPGETAVLQKSTDFSTWTPLATNTLTEIPWTYTETPSAQHGFYRAALR